MEEAFEFLGETQRVDKQYVAKEGKGTEGRVERYNEEGQKDV